MWEGYCRKIKGSQFARLIQKYDSFSPESDNASKEEILLDMFYLDKTFDDLRNIFYRARKGSMLEWNCSEIMFAKAKTFGNWLCVYCESVLDDIRKRIAADKLFELANNPVDVNWTKSAESLEAIKLLRWKKIFDVAITPDVEIEALARIQDLTIDQKIVASEKKKDSSPSKI